MDLVNEDKARVESMIRQYSEIKATKSPIAYANVIKKSLANGETTMEAIEEFLDKYNAQKQKKEAVVNTQCDEIYDQKELIRKWDNLSKNEQKLEHQAIDELKRSGLKNIEKKFNCQSKTNKRKMFCDFGVSSCIVCNPNQSAFYFSKKSWHDSFNLTSRTNNQYFGAGDDVMARLERVLKSQYVTNQARNIVRYFANINQDGFVFLTSQDIAEGTDLARSTIFRHINELKRKGLIYVHKCTPYPNVYELIFRGTIKSMFIHYFLILLLTFTIAIVPATTDAVAEDRPFGQASTYLRFSQYKGYLSIANSDYKYMMDIPKNNEIIVAVIDDHMSSYHESLQGQYWVNTAEKNGATGVDDDGNGYVDDIHGWDFDGNQPYQYQFGSPHGNQVAGIIMGKPITESNVYEHRIRGVNTDVKVMRIYQGDTVLSAEKEAEAIRYAVDNGAKVINLSHGVLIMLVMIF